MSPPPSKRARMNCKSNDTATMEFLTPSKLKKHENLWFEDGNIVLATEKHLYSVHRGVLARNSTVFKDMLDLPNVGNTSETEAEGVVTNGDSWEGKPLVKMVGDSDEDVNHLLMVLYDIGFYSALRPTTLPVILSLLRMSTKYDLPNIRNEVASHLERSYPRDLKSMEERSFKDLFVDHNNLAEDYDFKLLAVAEKCNLNSILPTLYFDCAASPIFVVLRATVDNLLERHQFERLVTGYEQMVKYSHQYGIKQFAPEQPCTASCSRARGQLLVNYVNSPPTFPILVLLQKGQGEDEEHLREEICESCSKTISENLEAFRLEIWNAIPELFGLGTWEDTKRD